MRDPFDPIETDDRRRVVAARDGVGATAGIRQGRDLRLDRLVTDRPTLVVVHAGTKTVVAGERSLLVRPGEAVLFLPGLVFDVINRPPADADYRARLFAWDDALLADFATPADAVAPPLVHGLSGLGRDFVSAFERAAEAVAEPDAVPLPLARHRAGELLLWLSLKGIRFPTETRPSWSHRLRRLFLADLAGAWTAARAASRLAIGESTLRRRLAEEATSFVDLLVDTRMTAAMNLVLSTDLPIDRIALDVGYASPSRFAVRFRHRFACAPSELRGHRRSPSSSVG
ncbi:MAG: helix-turn-helix transcriptional regulator [Siculibacillus sp.]